MGSVSEEEHVRRKAHLKQTPVHVLVQHAVEAAMDKKAEDVVVMDMRAVSGLADYFVICTGASDLQVKAIHENVEDRIKAACGERPWHREGEEFRQWVLLDFVDLVVHVFLPERRAFYDLERLWKDAPQERMEARQTAHISNGG